jgi:hypothetical protein
MAIVIYVHRPKRHAKPKAAPATALAGPAIVTASRKRRGPPAEVPVDPEAQERVRAFFERMGLKSRPTPEATAISRLSRQLRAHSHQPAQLSIT